MNPTKEAVRPLLWGTPRIYRIGTAVETGGILTVSHWAFDKADGRVGFEARELAEIARLHEAGIIEMGPDGARYVPFSPEEVAEVVDGLRRIAESLARADPV